jgi:hypothetical protein
MTNQNEPIDRRQMLSQVGAAAAGAVLAGGVSRAQAAAGDTAPASGPAAPRVEGGGGIPSICDFGVSPAKPAEDNARCLQKALDWAGSCGGAVLVAPTAEPYPMAGGLVLRRNASLVGVNGPTGRGTRHADKPQPVGSVFRIEDATRPFLTVEAASQVRGIQFWYARQTLDDPKKVIAYPPTIQVSQAASAQGVTLSCLTFYGEYTAMDFAAAAAHPCEQIIFEHCYGYPLSGQFVRIDRCYDIPRVLHCHANPANRRFIDGGYSRAVIDSVVAGGRFAYAIDHTDNAQLIDVFTFGTYGGIHLGPATYGQLTNFNFDCVAVGILKQGEGDFNRNWQIAQGSIIANTGPRLADVHPIIVEGQGHTALCNVEAFSGGNGALTTFNQSQDYILVRGDKKLTVSVVGCRMRNYVANEPITCLNPQAVIRADACVDKYERSFQGAVLGRQP